jgi:nucleoside diphosphate kinase
MKTATDIAAEMERLEHLTHIQELLERLKGFLVLRSRVEGMSASPMAVMSINGMAAVRLDRDLLEETLDYQVNRLSERLSRLGVQV